MDADSVDALQGYGADRHTSSKEAVAPIIGDVPSSPEAFILVPLVGLHTLVIANAGAAKQGIVILIVDERG